MQLSTAAEPGATAQDRHTAARSPRLPALGTRLTISVTLLVAAVITLITYVGTLIAQRQLDNDLRETAEVTAFAVADDVELRQEPIAEDALVPVLRSFMNAAPDLRSITVFSAVDGHAETLVSTSVIAPPPPSLVQNVIAHGETVTSQPAPDTLLVAVPVGQPGAIKGAVAVTVSTRAVRQLQRAAAVVAFGGDAFAVLAIAALISLLARLRDRNQELVWSYQSVSRLRETAARAQQLAAVGQTMANVAHQIGTPLNLVSGHVQPCSMKSPSPAFSAACESCRSRSTASSQPFEASSTRATTGRAADGENRFGPDPHGRCDAGTPGKQRRHTRLEDSAAASRRCGRRTAAGAGAPEPRDQRT